MAKQKIIKPVNIGVVNTPNVNILKENFTKVEKLENNLVPLYNARLGIVEYHNKQTADYLLKNNQYSIYNGRI